MLKEDKRLSWRRSSMVWTCLEERSWIYWTKDVRDEVTKKDEKRESSDETWRYCSWSGSQKKRKKIIHSYNDPLLSFNSIQKPLNRVILSPQHASHIGQSSFETLVTVTMATEGKGYESTASSGKRSKYTVQINKGNWQLHRVAANVYDFFFASIHHWFNLIDC